MQFFHKQTQGRALPLPYTHPAIDKLRRLTGEEWFPDPLSMRFISRGHTEPPILTCQHHREGLPAITLEEVMDYTDEVILDIVNAHHATLLRPQVPLMWCSTGAVLPIIKAEPIP